MPTTEQLKRQLLELSILTLVTIVIWTGYGIYSALTNPSESIVNEEELRDVPTGLNLGQFDNLRERLEITEDMFSSLEARIGVPVSEETISAATPSSLEATTSPSTLPNTSTPASPSSSSL